MANYCEESDLNTVYGTRNVSAMADMESLGTGDASLTARISYAIVWATAYIDAFCINSTQEFKFPITGTVPTLIEMCCVQIAMYKLARGRGEKDQAEGQPPSRWQIEFDDARATLAMINQGTLRVTI